MPDSQTYLVFDVESCGLHGEGFAVGWAVVGPAGQLLANGIAVAPPPARLEWLEENVMPHLPAPTEATTRAIRDCFWTVWDHWRDRGARLAADVPWPVEARFLSDCIADDGGREWTGPYPLIDIASVRLAVGLDPLGEEARLPMELPKHNPLADARQSARLLIEALEASHAR